MKRIKLQEASSLTSYDKMFLFDQGQRKENLKACGAPKLIDFYKTCLNNGFKNAEAQVKAELLNRGLGLYVWPEIAKIDASQFTPYEAQLLLQHKKDLDVAPVVANIYLNPFPKLTTAETLLVYLVWALVLDLPRFVSQIKVYFNGHIYFSAIPQMIEDIVNQPSVADIISDIIKGLPVNLTRP
jgi:hypothetical protein